MDTSKYSPYQRSIITACKELPEGASTADIADKLRGMGWNGSALEEATIEQAMSEIASDMIKGA